MLKVVLVTGISGSGKSVALRMLEDASYTCVDNLPVRFLAEFIANARDSGLERVAVAIDVRSPGELAELPDVVTALRAMGTSLRVIFLDASTITLVQRYSSRAAATLLPTASSAAAPRRRWPSASPRNASCWRRCASRNT